MKLIRAKYTSSGEKGKRGFEDLDCYQLSLDVMVNAHQVADSLPAEEKYDLVQQMAKRIDNFSTVAMDFSSPFLPERMILSGRWKGFLSPKPTVCSRGMTR